MRSSRLRIGTRGSRLSLRQTESVAEAIRQAGAGAVEIVVIDTAGDRAPDLPLERLEGTGLFSKALEAALLDGRCDVAVHSAKDLPTEIPADLSLAAFPVRTDPRDALVTPAKRGLAGLPPGARIGTSSVRRSAQLLHHRADLRCVPIRGNIDTRLGKLDQGAYEALCLAATGLIRMGWEGRITEAFPSSIMLPAPGQGAIAVEARRGDAALLELLRGINHPPTQAAVEAERAFAARLGSGCRAPAAALATIAGDDMTLEGLVASPDGRIVERCRAQGPAAGPAALGVSVAEALLARAGSLIEALRETAASAPGPVPGSR